MARVADQGEVKRRMSEIAGLIRTAEQRTRTDRSASPTLNAVVHELRDKCDRACSQLDKGGEAIRDALIALEQAADSAKEAAKADAGVSHDVRQAIIEAHDAVSRLKGEMV